MNGNSKHGALSLGLDDLSDKDRANTWKPFLMSFLVTGGVLAVCMAVIYWAVG